MRLLHDALIVKDNFTFWKMWKNKMGGKKPVATTINGSNDERDIVNKFANYFKGVGKVLHTKSKDFRALLQDKLKLYSGDEVCYNTIDVELVDTIIRHLDSGRASGADMLSSEHLLYNCHPIVIVFLTKLLKWMLKFQYVPNAFGIGVIIPIPKSTRMVNDKTDHYRGITISSVISKIFERCLLISF